MPRQKHRLTRRLFSQQIGLKFKEETSKLLHLEHSFVWWTLRKIDQKCLENFEMVVLEKNGGAKLARSCEQ